MNSDKVTGTDRPAAKSGQLAGCGDLEVETAPPKDAPPNVIPWVCALLQTSDSFFPTGSYAHSFGLEGLVQSGVVHDAATLRTFVFSSVLPALQHADLPIVAHAWRAFADSAWERIGALCVLSSALKTPREARLASENIGRQRAELVTALRRSPVAAEYLERVAKGGWPHSAAVSAALEAHAILAPLEAALASYAYSTLASSFAAAMKLLRIGQNGSQSLLTETLAALPEVIAAAERVPFDDIGWFNPWLDIAAARHETADARMFIS